MTNRSTPVRPKHLYEEIVEQIRELIRKGELKVGDRLPAERKLAATFKVSRNCVREAIRVLSEQKILESRRGDGTYVCASDETALVDALAQAIETQKKWITDIFEFRRIVEPQIASLAARNIDADEIDRLKVIVFDQKKKVLAGEDDSELDTAFHLALAIASKNKVLQQMVKTLNSVLNESRSEFLRSEERKRTSIDAHIRIIDALENRDADGAGQAMSDHLRQIEQTVFKKCTREDIG